MESETVEQWIWLQQAFGAGSPKPARLLAAMGGIREAYAARAADYARAGSFTSREISRLCDKSLRGAEDIVAACLRNGYRILTPEEMPERLRAIYSPPCALYVWGELPQPADGFYIAMVGTRQVTPYGAEAAARISGALASFHAVVVSGMAVGVDAASHTAAIRGGGKTVAVIGCGIDIDYPLPHRELKRLIAQNGAVVSEYPPGTRPDRAHFPTRNRIIAGLSLGTVVVEAGTRSGALITASLAAEMGRDVFAVPGSIFSPQSEGCNRLLRDGAKPACSVLDILEEYPAFCPQSIKDGWQEAAAQSGPPEQITLETLSKPRRSRVSAPSQAKKPETPACAPPEEEEPPQTPESPHLPEPAAPEGLSETQLAVFRQLSLSPRHVDEIALAANLELRRVLAVLTALEIRGLARSLPGRRYTLLR